MSDRFRDKFLAGLTRLHRDGQLKLTDEWSGLLDPDAFQDWLQPSRDCDWVVFIEPPPTEDAKPAQVLKYLARYLTGGPISDGRLIEHQDGKVNIAQIGAHSRNPLIIQHLRQFPDPPNLDAGEGVRMMFGTMREAGLYPPLYSTRPKIPREAVVVHLANQNCPSAWEQVSEYIDQHGSVGNAEVRRLLGTDDVLTGTRQLKAWVEQGLLIVTNPHAAKRVRRYTKPDTLLEQDLFSNTVR